MVILKFEIYNNLAKGYFKIIIFLYPLGAFWDFFNFTTPEASRERGLFLPAGHNSR